MEIPYINNDRSSTILNLEKEGSIITMDISPDGKNIALISENKQIVIFPFINGKVIDRNVKKFPREYTFYCIAYNPNGNSIISGDYRGVIVILDLMTEQEYQQETNHSDALQCIAWNPNGKSFASAGNDNKICLWEATSEPFVYDIVRTLQQHTNIINSIMYNSDGSRLVSGSIDGTMRLWDLNNTGKCVMTTSFENNSVVSSLVLSPNNDIFACGTSNTIFLYSFSNPDFEQELPTGDYVKAIAFSPNGEWIASASKKIQNSICIWNVGTNELEETFTGDEYDIPTSLHFHSQSQSLVVAFDSGHVRSLTLPYRYWTSSSVQIMDRSLESMSLPSVGFDYEKLEDIPIVKLKPQKHQKNIPILFLNGKDLIVLRKNLIIKTFKDPDNIVYECKENVPPNSLDIRKENVYINVPYFNLNALGVHLGLVKLQKIQKQLESPSKERRVKAVHDNTMNKLHKLSENKTMRYKTKLKHTRKILKNDQTDAPIFKFTKTSQKLSRIASKSVLNGKNIVGRNHCQSGHEFIVYDMVQVKKKYIKSKQSIRKKRNKSLSKSLSI